MCLCVNMTELVVVQQFLELHQKAEWEPKKIQLNFHAAQQWSWRSGKEG